MSCITGRTVRMSETLKGVSLDATLHLNGRTFLYEKLEGFTKDVSEHITGKSYYGSERLNGRCSIICSVAELKYLNVSPEEVVWITQDKGVVYEVDSNTEWIIVIN